MIYIAGKISDLPFQEAWDKFQKVENEFHSLGLQVINPLKLGIPLSWPWEQQIEKCLEVIERRATAIYFLTDWKDSEGAKLEFRKVSELNLHHNRNILIYREDKDGIHGVTRDVQDKVLTCLIPILE